MENVWGIFLTFVTRREFPGLMVSLQNYYYFFLQTSKQEQAWYSNKLIAPPPISKNLNSSRSQRYPEQRNLRTRY